MNREEAIKRLKEYAQYSYGIWHDDEEDTKAFDLAIEALRREEAEEKGYCHRINYIPKPCEVYEDYEHATLVDIKEPLVKHDREWIIGCIKHDGFIKTDRFDKANQIILDALSGEAETKCVAQIKVDTEEIVRRIKEEYDITDGWIPCSERLPSEDGRYLVCMNWKYENMEVLRWSDGWNCHRGYDGKISRESEIDGTDILAWMPLPKPYKEGAGEWLTERT